MVRALRNDIGITGVFDDPRLETDFLNCPNHVLNIHKVWLEPHDRSRFVEGHLRSCDSMEVRQSLAHGQGAAASRHAIDVKHHAVSPRDLLLDRPSRPAATAEPAHGDEQPKRRRKLSSQHLCSFTLRTRAERCRLVGP